MSSVFSVAAGRSASPQSTDGTVDPSIIEMMASAEGFDWLESALCRHMDIDDFFVRPGAALAPEVTLMCEMCPARRPCVRHSYALAVTAGHFGALSPGFRQSHTLEEALEEADRTTKERLSSPACAEVLEALLPQGASEAPVMLSDSQRTELRKAARSSRRPD